MSWRSTCERAFRISTLVVPSWLAWYVVFSVRRPDALVETVALALGPLWMALGVALAVRTAVIALGRGSRARMLDQLDVLTGAGVALAWSSSFAIVGAVWLGYPSLAAVGLLGTAVFHLVVLYNFAAIRGADPMHAASISRRFSPEVIAEGDAVTEEIRVAGARIPIGFRLFVTGRVGPRWATCRHALEAAESGSEVVLESSVGPAVRGEHDAELLEVWLEDVFGLCRSVRVPVGAAHLTVTPRARTLDHPRLLQGRGHGPRAPRPAPRLPTEGVHHLREYREGDDVRRIHWVRSISAGELIVRLPDEIPPDRARVRLVLDTFFPEACMFACDAPSELLDAIVGVWLAVGRALVEAGVRVTLVAAVSNEDDVKPRLLELLRRDPGSAQRLAAQISWQGRVPVDQLLTDDATFVVSRGVLTCPPPWDDLRWIVVLPELKADVPCDLPSSARLPFPMGSSENRWSHRRRRQDELARTRTDQARAMLAMRTNVAPPPPGSLAAIPLAGGLVHLEVIS